MAIIRKQDLIDSVAEGLQYISYYHPSDFINALNHAYQIEQNPAAKGAIAQILINSRMSAYGKRPICQDTGIVVCFVKIGMQAQWDCDETLQSMIDEGVRRAYCNPNNPLRKSVLLDPAGARINSKDNTPAVIHVEMVKGADVEITLAAKGGGSENKAKMIMMNPSDDIATWVEQMLPIMGAGWCPPGILGIGIGGTPEKSAVLAKEALMEPIDMQDLISRGPKTFEEKLRVAIYERANATGIGAQGLGGTTTVLDVKIKSAPTHAASKPVTMIPNCAATRHIHFKLDGTGPAHFEPPKLEDWPEISLSSSSDIRRVNLNTLTQSEQEQWRAGDNLLLSGTILTGRDAAHKRIQEMLAKGEKIPVDFKNKFIYYVGPVDAVRDEVVGPAGPTTSTRMDKFSEMMIGELGLSGMIGKADRGQETCDIIKKYKAVYLMAVGGAAYLVSKAIKKAEIVAFADLGMEAVHQFEIEDMPVTVAVDSLGDSIHQIGPKIWKIKLAEAKK